MAKYFVLYHIPGGNGVRPEKEWRSFNTEETAKRFYDSLKGLVTFRVLSSGLGDILAIVGKP